MFPVHLPPAALALLVTALGFCAQDGPLQRTPSTASPDSMGPPPPYTFDQPAAVFHLDDDLDEISGLTVLDEGVLGAIQDEDGKLFIVDANTGVIRDDKKFEDDGDYEGIERVGDRVFVLRSDGTLFEIEDWRAKKLKARKHNTPLGDRYDTEGLAYDAAHHRLLIACKEYAGKDLPNQRAIYAFDLETNELLETPAFTIDLDALNALAGGGGTLNDRIREAVQPVLDLSGFKPSALGIHPRTGDLYVLSSVRKLIAVLSPDGALQAAWPLPDALFAQPEGLTFQPNGDLYIASEAAGGPAVLVRYTYHEP